MHWVLTWAFYGGKQAAAQQSFGSKEPRGAIFDTRLLVLFSDGDTSPYRLCFCLYFEWRVKDILQARNKNRGDLFQPAKKAADFSCSSCWTSTLFYMYRIPGNRDLRRETAPCLENKLSDTRMSLPGI